MSTSPTTPPTPFKIAFIGAGFIARLQMKHCKPLHNVEFCGVADPSELSLKKMAEEYPDVRQFADYKQMLSDVACDAVSVCTPNGLHAENTIAALEAGRHVLVEKPMAMSAKEAQRMVDAAKRAGKELVIGFQHRFDAKTKLIRDQIAADSFGKILYVRAQALRRRGIPNWGVFGRKELQGGGPMIDIGVHILESAHYMIGSPRPVSASGGAWTYMGNKPSEVASMWPEWDHRTYNVEDLAVGMIRFDTGTILVIESSFVAHIEKDIWNVTLMGEKGGAVWDTSQIFTDHGGYQMNMTPGWIGKWDVFEYKMKHFVEVCREGRKNEAPAEHGLMVQKMLDGVYESAENGREVSIE